MSNICTFSRLPAILLAIILLTAPVSSALAAGYGQNNETHDSDYNKNNDSIKVNISDNDSKADAKIGNNNSNSNNDENSHDKLKSRLSSLQTDPESPLILKQQAYRNLSLIAPVENKTNIDIIKKLDNAKFHIAESIASGLWYDKTHLKPFQEPDNDGKRKEKADIEHGFDIETTVFKAEKTATQNILEIISKNKDGAIDDDQLIEALINLLQADRNIAQMAIMDAQRAASRYDVDPKSQES